MFAHTKERLLAVHPEVAAALAAGAPVVALESNVIAHGLPYPKNLEVIEAMEAAIRAAGAVPATTAIKGGKILVGLSAAEKRFYATQDGLPKASSRDLPMLLASGAAAVTTVAASLVAAELAGIGFFASAGIGGVHRGASESFDISSDLIQLTRSPVVAVSAGTKKILDIALTLEFLETHCVPCVTYQFNEFPAFYVRSSGLKSPCRIDDLTELARAIAVHQNLSSAGFLVAAPIAAEEALDDALIEEAIQRVTAQATRDGVTGKGLTKYVMRAVNAAVAGQADDANAAILISNARFAAELSVRHAALTCQNKTRRVA